ncbi:Outer membrane receptor proteins, mostly Fe transport [Rhodoblastus acidophilus]|uniref:Outer membrane receptor proteins, mostly Fe transport n=1 Tax=Rhodoblastus acidophilus TaxID=1074 RepID=A0A212S9S2_RHOAC|nr:TonB-dependent receptor [Rhodoblastus acidophilus]PPQ36282.1 ligand-gated channel [Rhodoblastus acidophilus]RAI20395.1 ligand-gated channel [Rhodoblastus acidophilus]SNB82000.1 Outer membrane receptor proteins, mostly Fe transport [Rhodoblastus acidophilus]
MRSNLFSLLGGAFLSIGAGATRADPVALPDIDVAASRAPAAQSDAGAPADHGAAAAASDPAATQARILPRGGANAFDIGADAIARAPQGANSAVEKILLQAPGVSLDSVASGQLHVRNEHGNVQYRVNGVMLPEGVAGFGSMLETGFIGNIALLTGALPAQYGLRTAGVVDIASKRGAFADGGAVSLYGGSHGDFTRSVEYGGTLGQTEYFFAGRWLQSDLGLENPTPGVTALHDRADQGKFFGYVSSRLEDGGRLSLITGTSASAYQIPANPNQDAFAGASAFLPANAPANSAQLKEKQYESNLFNVLSWQKSFGGADVQLAYFSRYSRLAFAPDTLGDLLYNGLASRVERTSFLNGVQADSAWKVGDRHVVRAGVFGSGEDTRVSNALTAFPTDDSGAIAGFPVALSLDGGRKFGWQWGGYVQDQWKISERLTLDAGLRFDQIYQYVNANQVSPRLNLTYEPFEGTRFHAGFARYFTPPSQALAAPSNLALFAGTTAAPAVALSGAVLPERSSVFDIGWDQKILDGLTMGVDAYYKEAHDLLDDGQFGQALVLTAFNYDRAVNEGLEFKVAYEAGDFHAYANLAWARQVASKVVSNQYLFDPDELAYIASHDIPTDHAQTLTGSAGASYLWRGTRLSADLIYGSGMRSGFANLAHVPAYAQVNFGLSHEFAWGGDLKPTTLRFDIVNAFDSVYVIRDGSGIGVFAPQYGPRRGFFIGVSQKL